MTKNPKKLILKYKSILQGVCYMHRFSRLLRSLYIDFNGEMTNGKLLRTVKKSEMAKETPRNYAT